MKRILSTIAILAVCTASFAAKTPKNAKFTYKEATDLTVIGKLCPDTPNPYHRVDTVTFKGFTKGENKQMRCSAGIAVAFRTNSSCIMVKPEYGETYRPVNGADMAYVGFDLYIKKDGKWLWAGDGVNKESKQNDPIRLVRNMDGSEHECLIYLPMYSELYSVKIGVVEGSTFEAIPNPFRHRIGIFGSSYTQGVSCVRSGMSYPMQLERMTGYHMLSIAASGNCKLQQYFADVICASDWDAFIFDTFSNPTPEMIRERLEPFIKKIRLSHPDEPLIFQQTIYRERRNFDTEIDDYGRRKMETAESMMKEMCKKYKNVYFITPCATSPDHETSVDGTHPNDYGYTLWARSIEKQVVKILKKHGLK